MSHTHFLHFMTFQDIQSEFCQSAGAAGSVQTSCVSLRNSVVWTCRSVFFPQNERQTVHFPLYPQPGLLFAPVSPKLPCTFKISFKFEFQMEFQSLECDCGKSEGPEEQYGSGKGSLCKISIPHPVFAQTSSFLHSVLLSCPGEFLLLSSLSLTPGSPPSLRST